jgi:hypothetical protein
VSGTVTAIILGISALATLVLVQARQIMREIARTAEEWRKLKQALSKNTDVEPGTEKERDRGGAVGGSPAQPCGQETAASRPDGAEHRC